MMKKFFVLVTTSVLALTMSCKENEDPETILKDPTLTIDPPSKLIVIDHQGQSALLEDGEEIGPIFSFRVSTNQDDWDVESNQEWLTVRKVSMYFRLDVNPVLSSVAPPPAKITITAGAASPVTLNVQQMGQDPSLIVMPSPEAIIFSASGKSATSDNVPFTTTFTVASNEPTWDVVSDQEWLKVTKDGKTFTLTAAANNIDTPNPEALVTVSGVEAEPVVISVTQSTEFFLQIDPRPVSNIEIVEFNPSTQTSTLRITWGEAISGSINSLVRYKGRSNGEPIELIVPNSQTQTTLTDVGNRFNHSDDILNVSTVIGGEQEDIETRTKEEQLIQFLASGTRVESTVYEGSSTQFTFTYANQEKMFRMKGRDEKGDRVYESLRVADFSPLRLNTALQIIVTGEQTGNVSGQYTMPQNTIDGGFTFVPSSGNVSLQYTVKTTTGNYSVTETLVPKTTPIEIEAPKPFTDVRASIPGDNTTNYGGYPFENLWDGRTYPPVNSGWLSAASSSLKSITISLQQPMILTRMIAYPHIISGGGGVPQIYDDCNVMKLEIWGAANLDETKLSDEEYWADSNEPGTFKDEWVYLGLHEVLRLDKRAGAIEEAQTILATDGHHFLFPESAVPVKYIRIFNREFVPWASIPNCWGFGELSFFGYEQ